MSTASKSSAKTRASTKDTTPKNIDAVSSTRSVYADYDVWTDKKRPKWHPVKKMRYVFFRMIHGCTITDALKEIKWSPSEFWHLIDKKENDVFHKEYLRAKVLQGRAIADHIVAISEGRDGRTKQSLAKMRKMIIKGLRRASKQKSAMGLRAVVESILSQIDVNGRNVISRNKVQIDAAKWLAEAVNPGEFGKKTSVAVGGLGAGENGGVATGPVLIQFVAPDGSVIDPSTFGAEV